VLFPYTRKEESTSFVLNVHNHNVLSGTMHLIKHLLPQCQHHVHMMPPVFMYEGLKTESWQHNHYIWSEGSATTKYYIGF